MLYYYVHCTGRQRNGIELCFVYWITSNFDVFPFLSINEIVFRVYKKMFVKVYPFTVRNEKWQWKREKMEENGEKKKPPVCIKFNNTKWYPSDLLTRYLIFWILCYWNSLSREYVSHEKQIECLIVEHLDFFFFSF